MSWRLSSPLKLLFLTGQLKLTYFRVTYFRNVCQFDLKKGVDRVIYAGQCNCIFKRHAPKVFNR